MSWRIMNNVRATIATETTDARIIGAHSGYSVAALADDLNIPGHIRHIVTIVPQTVCDPQFYGGTFCAQCCVHKPVDEFVWEGTDERVGS